VREFSNNIYYIFISIFTEYFLYNLYMIEKGLNLNNEDRVIENRSESISSLFNPVPIPNEVSPDRKYDGSKNLEERTRDFIVLNGHIRKKSKSKGHRNYDREREELADFREEESEFHMEEDINDSLGEVPVPSVSEALRGDGDMDDVEPEWRKYLDINGKTPENNKENRNAANISPLTPEDIRRSKLEKYFIR